MDKYTIIDWPDCQRYMTQPGWEDNSTLIDMNESMGIGSSTFLVCRDWLMSLDENSLYQY